MLSPWAAEAHWCFLACEPALTLVKTVKGSYRIIIPGGNAVILIENQPFQLKSHPKLTNLLGIFCQFSKRFKQSKIKTILVRDFDTDFLLPQLKHSF